MPNGFHGSKEAWERLESPLRTLDNALQEYAVKHGMTLGRNYHSWPERSLVWTDDAQRKIQLYLDSEENLRYTVGIAAWRRSADGYFVRQEMIIESKSIDEIREDLSEILDRARLTVAAWSATDLPRSPGPYPTKGGQK